MEEKEKTWEKLEQDVGTLSQMIEALRNPKWQKVIPIRRERRLGFWAIAITIHHPLFSQYKFRKLQKKDGSHTWYFLQIGRLLLSCGGKNKKWMKLKNTGKVFQLA